MRKRKRGVKAFTKAKGPSILRKSKLIENGRVSDYNRKRETWARGIWEENRKSLRETSKEKEG